MQAWKLKRIETVIPDVFLIEPQAFADERGQLMEVYQEQFLRNQGVPIPTQENQVFSFPNVLRGLHYQLRNPQAKLVRCIRGGILDVAVDLRQGSPTYRRYVVATLTENNHRQLYVPEGFAHGYFILSGPAVVLYRVSGAWDPHDEYGIRWDDPTLAIPWGARAPLISNRDRQLPLLESVPPERLPTYSEAK